MRILSVCGITKSGKTTTIENIIRELSARGYRVGSVKEIHNEKFAIDPDPNSNTHRHRMAGAELVCARGLNETDVLFPEKLPMSKILSFYEDEKKYDWVVLEGVADIPVPTIVTAHGDEDLTEKFSDMTFCISGRISSSISEYRGVPAINSLDDITGLVDLIERKVYELLPDFPPECCSACGLSCKELAKAILNGQKSRDDCVVMNRNRHGIELIINGKRIHMVPFVQKILKNEILGIVGELDGYAEGGSIEIRF